MRQPFFEVVDCARCGDDLRRNRNARSIPSLCVACEPSNGARDPFRESRQIAAALYAIFSVASAAPTPLTPGDTGASARAQGSTTDD